MQNNMQEAFFDILSIKKRSNFLKSYIYGFKQPYICAFFNLSFVFR